MSETLFGRGRLGDLISDYPRAIQGEVDSWERNKVLAASETDLVDYLVGKYFLDAPTLVPRDHWESVADETAVDVTHDPMRVPFRDGRRILIPGHRVSVRVPFDGDADLFHFLPSTQLQSPTGDRLQAGLCSDLHRHRSSGHCRWRARSRGDRSRSRQHGVLSGLGTPRLHRLERKTSRRGHRLPECPKEPPPATSRPPSPDRSPIYYFEAHC